MLAYGVTRFVPAVGAHPRPAGLAQPEMSPGVGAKLPARGVLGIDTGFDGMAPQVDVLLGERQLFPARHP